MLIYFKVYTKVPSPQALASSFTNTNVRMKYTSYCMDHHIYREKDELIYLFISDPVHSRVYRIKSPYTSLEDINIPLKYFNGKTEVMEIVNDVSKGNEVFLVNVLVDKVMLARINA